MGPHSESSKLTQLYGKLSEKQQKEFGKAVITKLRTLIGGHGELSVLAEYIAVMLQSSRPPEQIQSELEAFLQEQSQPFTDWLCKELARHVGEEQSPAPDAEREALLLRVVADVRQGAEDQGQAPDDSKGEALLLRAVQDARQGTQAAAALEASAGGGSGRHRGAEAGERERRGSRAQPGRAGAAAGATERAPRHRGERSRSRRRRREHKDKDGKKPAVLTPNVEFLRDAYHGKGLATPAEEAAKEQPQGEPAAPPDTRWSFRADPTAPPPAVAGAMHWHNPDPAGGSLGTPGPAPAGPPPAHHPGAPPPMPGHCAPPPGFACSPYHPYPMAEPSPPQAPPVRPRHFVPKKWKVARSNTVVRATEHLNSEEVQMLQEGEIVEQVAPAFKLKNNIVRIQIRHPSSPQFPNPIGWVTQDATAAGGPKFLEPGPEPMQRGNWRPPAADHGGGGGGGFGGGGPAAAAYAAPPWAASKGSWRPMRPSGPAVGGGKGGGGARAPGPFGYQNLTWTPASAKPGSGTEPIMIAG